MELRPHIMKWEIPGAPGGNDPVTGYPLPDLPGEVVEVRCRFHPGGSKSGTKTFLLDNGTTVIQQGSIRLDAGVSLPLNGQHIIVTDLSGDTIYFTGNVLDSFKGQLSYRVDV